MAGDGESTASWDGSCGKMDLRHRCSFGLNEIPKHSRQLGYYGQQNKAQGTFFRAELLKTLFSSLGPDNAEYIWQSKN